MRGTLCSMDEKKLFQKLTNPKKIQDFINTLKKRTDFSGHIVRSPRITLAAGDATCIEGALVAAYALMRLGEKPLLLDLKVGARNENDVDHVVALFKKDGYWGAISKTSHAVLRYREPIYKSIRELALSYFHEYFTDDGKKTLRSFSEPFDVRKHFGTAWAENDEDLFEIAVAIDESPHTMILTPNMERNLRRADSIEISAGKLTD